MFFSLLDESLAPTPVSEAEQKRNIRLRQRGRRGEGVGNPRQRTSLEEFVDKLRNQVIQFLSNFDNPPNLFVG